MNKFLGITITMFYVAVMMFSLGFGLLFTMFYLGGAPALTDLSFIGIPLLILAVIMGVKIFRFVDYMIEIES